MMMKHEFRTLIAAALVALVLVSLVTQSTAKKDKKKPSKHDDDDRDNYEIQTYRSKNSSHSSSSSSWSKTHGDKSALESMDFNHRSSETCDSIFKEVCCSYDPQVAGHLRGSERILVRCSKKKINSCCTPHELMQRMRFLGNLARCGVDLVKSILSFRLKIPDSCCKIIIFKLFCKSKPSDPSSPGPAPGQPGTPAPAPGPPSQPPPTPPAPEPPKDPFGPKPPKPGDMELPTREPFSTRSPKPFVDPFKDPYKDRPDEPGMGSYPYGKPSRNPLPDQGSDRSPKSPWVSKRRRHTRTTTEEPW